MANPQDPAPIPESEARPKKVKANPMRTEADGKVHHIASQAERTIAAAFPAFHNALAAENLADDLDLTAADLQDFS